LNNIYFDFDKFNIRKNAAIELRKLADYLQKNTAVQISIRSHTDCRNTNKYNQVLSERRAKSTFNWLVKNGIEAWRLDYQGFGESQLVNGCHDNVHCSAAEHQLNRRSEFIITKM
jgi:outer membrane protein OmpA-like peptidoglycan-associated protein